MLVPLTNNLLAPLISLIPHLKSLLLVQRLLLVLLSLQLIDLRLIIIGLLLPVQTHSIKLDDKLLLLDLFQLIDILSFFQIVLNLLLLGLVIFLQS